MENHGSTIGLVLCATHNKAIVRYALDGINKPVGVAAWQTQASKVLVDQAPKDMCLPTIQKLQEGLGNIVDSHASEFKEVEDN
jgi:hypothetical protein